MHFTVTLTDDDWDQLKGGWRCSALQIPESSIKDIFVNGSIADKKSYQIDPELQLIRWAQKNRPKQVGIQVSIKKELSTQELTTKWKKLAILLPIVGSLITAILTNQMRASVAVKYELEKVNPSTQQVLNIGLVKYFVKSNDFLASSEDNSFERSLLDAKREVWFVGTSFYISTDLYRDSIKKKLSEGININFLVFDPYGSNIENVAKMMNVSAKEISDQCSSGIKTFIEIKRDTEIGKYPGQLNIKIVNENIYSRIYFFDPKIDSGITYYVPQINRANSQNLPGFLVNNSKAKFHSVYFDGVLKLWNEASSLTLVEWRAAHPEFQ